MSSKNPPTKAIDITSFFYAPRPHNGFDHCIPIGRGHLHINGLPPTFHSKQSSSLLCMGFLCDPRTPKDGISELLEGIQNLNTVTSTLDTSFHWGGIYLLFHHTPSNTYVIPDSGALRPCFYIHTNGFTYLSGSAKELVRHLPEHLRPEPEDTDFFQRHHHQGELFIAGRTPWQGVHQLLPNHYLNLNTGSAHRYFPSTSLLSRTVDEAIPPVRSILEGQWEALVHRFPVVLPLTAGWDSRVLLATGRSLIENIRLLYTIKRTDTSDRHEDVLIPPKLAKLTGRNHQFLLNHPDADKADLRLIEQHVDSPNPRTPGMVTHIYNAHLAGHLIVSGIASETAKRYYGEEKNLSAERLAVLSGYGTHSFAVKAWQDWLEQSSSITDLGYDLLDFFHWEFNVGSSVAREATEINLSQASVYAPFNHKQLIDILLSVDSQNRDMYDHRFYQKLIHACWPELMQFQVNPNPKLSVIRLMKRLKIYNVYSDFKRRFLKKK